MDVGTGKTVVTFLDKSQSTTHNKLVLTPFLFFSHLFIHWFNDLLGSRVGIVIVNSSSIGFEVK